VSISVNEERAAANDRLTAIRLAMLTMRCMERWRRNVSDYDKAMILLAVVAITAERFTRGALDEDLKAIAQPLDPEALAACNVSSIASATGINRETTRRKVKALVDEGFLVRSEQGVIAFAPGHFQKDYIEGLIRSQLDSLVRTTNDLIRDGTLETDR
jgi:hypothetical protein